MWLPRIFVLCKSTTSSCLSQNAISEVENAIFEGIFEGESAIFQVGIIIMPSLLCSWTCTQCLNKYHTLPSVCGVQLCNNIHHLVIPQKQNNIAMWSKTFISHSHLGCGLLMIPPLLGTTTLGIITKPHPSGGSYDKYIHVCYNMWCKQ